MVSKEEYNQLEADFESIINDKNVLQNAYKEKVDESTLNFQVSFAYQQEGFPNFRNKSDIDDLNYEVDIHINKDAAILADLYISEVYNKVEDQKSEGMTLQDLYSTENLINFIFDEHKESVNMRIVVKDDLQEYLKEHVDFENIVKQLADAYDENKVREIIEEVKDEKSVVIEKIGDAKDEVGIDRDIANEHIEFQATDIKPMAFEEIAQRLYKDIEKTTLEYYIEEDYHYDLVTNELVDFNIIIFTEAEDIKEQLSDFFDRIDGDFVEEYIGELEMKDAIEQDYKDDIIELRQNIAKNMLSGKGVDENALAYEMAQYEDYFIETVAPPSDFDPIIDTMKELCEENGFMNEEELGDYLYGNGEDAIIQNGHIAISETPQSNAYTYVVEINEDEYDNMLLESEFDAPNEDIIENFDIKNHMYAFEEVDIKEQIEIADASEIKIVKQELAQEYLDDEMVEDEDIKNTFVQDSGFWLTQLVFPSNLSRVNEVIKNYLRERNVQNESDIEDALLEDISVYIYDAGLTHYGAKGTEKSEMFTYVIDFDEDEARAYLNEIEEYY